MSDADEQVVRDAFARWNSGEHTVDPQLIDPEIEIYSALVQQTFRGYEGAEAWAREIDEQFADWRIEIHASRELGDGRLLLEGTIFGRGRQSGVDLDQPGAWLAEVRGGRLLRLLNFIGHDAAARGLEEAGK